MTSRPISEEDIRALLDEQEAGKARQDAAHGNLPRYYHFLDCTFEGPINPLLFVSGKRVVVEGLDMQSDDLTFFGPDWPPNAGQ